jgi:hypothetical protein
MCSPCRLKLMVAMVVVVVVVVVVDQVACIVLVDAFLCRPLA